MKTPYVVIAALSVLLACVPQKKYLELEAGNRKCQEDNEKFKSRVQELETALEKSTNSGKELQSELDLLRKEHDALKGLYDETKLSYDKLSASFDLLSENKNKLLAENANETKQLITQLHNTQLALQEREDRLKLLEAAVLDKESSLNKLTADLEMREKRVKELENMLAKKDSAVTAIRKRVQAALMGFENNGLSIEQRNGKVYVSLEESLLFALGKYEIDSRGAEALKKLAVVLEQNPDINITVEGHTDNVPYRGSGDLTDNWDLSVKRATSVVKIITQNSKIDPKRLTASGRSEYLPMDSANTKEGRQKNRRTEIILTPKLDELYNFLNEAG